jgi:cytochrome oxidase Cu insertion factor (SCO1/SenC/PrrC family)
MVAVSKRIVRLLALSAVALAPTLLSAQSEIPTGPAVGEKIPRFEAVDQSGRRQTFETLKGANGLLLLFHRSADW